MLSAGSTVVPTCGEPQYKNISLLTSLLNLVESDNSLKSNSLRLHTYLADKAACYFAICKLCCRLAPRHVLVLVPAPVLQLSGRAGEEGAAPVQSAEETREPGKGSGPALPSNHDGSHLPAGNGSFIDCGRLLA